MKIIVKIETKENMPIDAIKEMIEKVRDVLISFNPEIEVKQEK